MFKKWFFIFPLITILSLLPYATAIAYNNTFVYEFDTTLRGKNRKINTNDDIVFSFHSAQCRKGHKIKIEVRHYVFGPDTTLTRKTIPECGGKVVVYVHDKYTPVYVKMSKPHDGYWVKGTGKIYSQKR
ncbi:hypothetical protein [Bacillus sp. NEB1478]|uniref:hypothetical protein n=1 Tax=Bacillus sp. NEB1478 TaxID=3073816 RepID=UPI002873F194|nr:hypothetical protein [Bacillus sp. NEB1478]WNB93107.1 hypothetical protein RGB74_05395 [Bacillus sp. NEB1478]